LGHRGQAGPPCSAPGHRTTGDRARSPDVGRGVACTMVHSSTNGGQFALREVTAHRRTEPDAASRHPGAEQGGPAASVAQLLAPTCSRARSRLRRSLMRRARGLAELLVVSLLAVRCSPGAGRPVVRRATARWRDLGNRRTTFTAQFADGWIWCRKPAPGSTSGGGRWSRSRWPRWGGGAGLAGGQRRRVLPPTLAPNSARRACWGEVIELQVSPAAPPEARCATARHPDRPAPAVPRGGEFRRRCRLLNGGGLAQLKDIVHERQTRDPQATSSKLESQLIRWQGLTEAARRQRATIVRAIDGWTGCPPCWPGRPATITPAPRTRLGPAWR